MPRPTRRSKTTKKEQVTRKQHQQKSSIGDEDSREKGKKRMRGEPLHYDEVKQPTTFTLTPTAKAGLNTLSQARSISMSELIERVGRGIIKLVDDQDLEDI